MMSLLWKVIGAGLFSAACAGWLTAGLTEKNPFVWPDFEPPEDRRPSRPDPAQQRGEDIEFHAVYELDGVTRALIRNRSDQSFKWVTLGEESEDGVLAKSYNRENDQLLLASSDGERWLDLESVAAPTASAQRPSRPGVQRPTPGATSPGSRTPSSATRSPSTTQTPSTTQAATSTRQPPSVTTSQARPTVRPAASSSDRRRVVPMPRRRGGADPGLEPPSYTPPEIGTAPPETPPPSRTPGPPPRDGP